MVNNNALALPCPVAECTFRYLQEVLNRLPADRLWVQIAEDLDGQTKEKLATWLGIDTKNTSKPILPHKTKSKPAKAAVPGNDAGLNPSSHSGTKLKVCPCRAKASLSILFLVIANVHFKAPSVASL